ncbi:hypothetical protein ACGF5C_04325 [Micromonospora sp. NPDC047620]|uniref:hypothetical protein n=1 Tax=Micromonospora sp. NPDC047620 TaxID=3364251 RepID=UPI0037129FA7
MAAQLLTIEVTRLDAGRARLRLAGELDFSCWTAPGWPSCWPWTAPPTATPARRAEVAPGAARPLTG